MLCANEATSAGNSEPATDVDDGAPSFGQLAPPAPALDNPKPAFKRASPELEVGVHSHNTAGDVSEGHAPVMRGQPPRLEAERRPGREDPGNSHLQGGASWSAGGPSGGSPPKRACLSAHFMTEHGDGDGSCSGYVASAAAAAAMAYAGQWLPSQHLLLRPSASHHIGGGAAAAAAVVGPMGSATRPAGVSSSPWIGDGGDALASREPYPDQTLERGTTIPAAGSVSRHSTDFGIRHSGAGPPQGLHSGVRHSRAEPPQGLQGYPASEASEEAAALGTAVTRDGGADVGCVQESASKAPPLPPPSHMPQLPPRPRSMTPMALPALNLEAAHAFRARRLSAGVPPSSPLAMAAHSSLAAAAAAATAARAAGTTTAATAGEGAATWPFW